MIEALKTVPNEINCAQARDKRCKVVRLRRLEKLAYFDPFQFLHRLRKIEYIVSTSDTPDRVKTLRTNKLKPEREMRDAALFCAGMAHRLATEILFAPVEDQDFDFVAACRIGDIQNFIPVQLKEVPPQNLNPTISIQDIVDKLTRYTDSSDLAVAIKLNQCVRFEPSELHVPPGLSIGELWVFGATVVDQSEWGVWGDFLKTGASTIGIRYPYPILQS